jgi:hypothetical protein
MLSAGTGHRGVTGNKDQRTFRVGQDREGHWLVVESNGASGGIFTSRDAALHYAAFETGHMPGAITVSPEPLELKI